MSNLTISDLILDGDFFEQLTKEDLEMNVFGGATGAGSISAAQYSQKDNNESAVTATVAASSPRPFKINLGYSFTPLFVTAGVYFD